MPPAGRTVFGVTTWDMPGRPKVTLEWGGPGARVMLREPGRDVQPVSGACDTLSEAQRAVDTLVGCAAPQAAPQPAPDPGEWIFTFGAGHYLFAGHANYVSVFAGMLEPVAGLCLADRFVRIKGSRQETRQQMIKLFGRVWCDQYPSEEAAGVREYGLRELEL